MLLYSYIKQSTFGQDCVIVCLYVYRNCTYFFLCLNKKARKVAIIIQYFLLKNNKCKQIFTQLLFFLLISKSLTFIKTFYSKFFYYKKNKIIKKITKYNKLYICVNIIDFYICSKISKPSPIFLVQNLQKFY